MPAARIVGADQAERDWGGLHSPRSEGWRASPQSPFPVLKTALWTVSTRPHELLEGIRGGGFAVRKKRSGGLDNNPSATILSQTGAYVLAWAFSVLA